uniref:Exportin-1/Importin-beta-like domain-containing protein n=1 Tax=Parascaris univalens TaxID=6257 RepID=A0A915CBF7_PARUN
MHTTATEHIEPVHKVASRLRSYEDFNLAQRLQDEEFGRHYALNRMERRRMGIDLRQSLREQAIEDRIATECRAQQNSCITEADEAIARRLQLEFEREEALKKESQARLDAELARRLQLNEEIQRQEAEDERLARYLQQQLSGSQHGGGIRSTESSSKKVLPLLASVTPKIRIGGWIPLKRRSNSERNASADPQWCDRIDERSQNELNLQMATASGIAVESDGPVPSHISSRSTVIARSRTPLATLATRDRPQPSGSVQRPPLLNSKQDPFDNSQQRISHYLYNECATRKNQPVSRGNAHKLSMVTTSSATPNSIPFDSDADLIQLLVPASSVASTACENQVPEEVGRVTARQRSSAFALNEVVEGGSKLPATGSQTAVVRLPTARFPSSQQTADMRPATSGETVTADATVRRYIPFSRPQVSFALGEVPSSLLTATTEASLALPVPTTASITRISEPLIPERIGNVPLPAPYLSQSETAPGMLVKSSVQLLEKRCSETVNTASSIPPDPISVVRQQSDGNVCEPNSLTHFTSRSRSLPFPQAPTQSVSTDASVRTACMPQSPYGHIQLLQTNLPSTLPGVASLHATNPFLNDLQSFIAPISRGNALAHDEAIVMNRAANGGPQTTGTVCDFAPASSDMSVLQQR